MDYTKRGELFGTEIGTALDDNGNYLIQVPVTPLVTAMVRALFMHDDVALDHVRRENDAYLIPYTDAVDAWLMHAVDLLIDMRRNRPGYGQLEFRT